MTKKILKQLRTPKDLGNIHPLDEVKVTFRYDKPVDPKYFPLKSKGIFGGSFEVNNEKYLVISHATPSGFFAGQNVLTSYLYKIENQEIVNKMNRHYGYFTKGDKLSLEDAITRHVRINEAELKELQKEELTK